VGILLIQIIIYQKPPEKIEKNYYEISFLCPSSNFKRKIHKYFIDGFKNNNK